MRVVNIHSQSYAIGLWKRKFANIILEKKQAKCFNSPFIYVYMYICDLCLAKLFDQIWPKFKTALGICHGWFLA